MTVNPLKPRVTAYLFFLARLSLLPGLKETKEKPLGPRLQFSNGNINASSAMRIDKSINKGELFRSLVKFSQ